jgi:hypothetical protein
MYGTKTEADIAGTMTASANVYNPRGKDTQLELPAIKRKPRFVSPRDVPCIENPAVYPFHL